MRYSPYGMVKTKWEVVNSDGLFVGFMGAPSYEDAKYKMKQYNNEYKTQYKLSNKKVTHSEPQNDKYSIRRP